MVLLKRLPLLLLLAGCAAPEPPNVLLLVSDTFRADALDCRGGGAETPNLCALAERGVLFEQAYAAAPWTLPSSVAMMTGSYPGQFRREHRGGDRPAELEAFYYVPEEELLLAEVLRDRGFAVECVLENTLSRRANTMQGFVDRRFGRKRQQRMAARLAGRLDLEIRDPRYLAVLWLADFFLDPQREKFFLLHWTDDPHAAYQPPRAFLAELQDELAALPRPLEYYLGLGHIHQPDEDLRKLRREVDGLAGEEVAFLKRLYHLEAKSVDERIGIVLEALETSGRAEETVVVFTSDHGEEFGEHGGFLHGTTLYQELVHVPLVFAGPGIDRGRRVAGAVSHVDLMPTLAELVGVTLGAGVQGRSLVPALRGERLDRRPVYLESPDRLDRDGLVAAGRKILSGSAEKPLELYDLAADPRERRNLAATEPELAERMTSMLDKVRRDHDLLRQVRADVDSEELARALAETREQMEALGYLE